MQGGTARDNPLLVGASFIVTRQPHFGQPVQLITARIAYPWADPRRVELAGMNFASAAFFARPTALFVLQCRAIVMIALARR